MEYIIKKTESSNHTNDIVNKATYKQTWAVAFHFAEANINHYPAISVDVLAKRIWASMLNYYDEINAFLSSTEVSQYLNDQLSCPEPILDRVIYNEVLN